MTTNKTDVLLVVAILLAVAAIALGVRANSSVSKVDSLEVRLTVVENTASTTQFIAADSNRYIGAAISVGALPTFDALVQAIQNAQMQQQQQATPPVQTMMQQQQQATPPVQTMMQ